MKINKYWFKPKLYGYGAYPTTWEGWTLILIFLILFGYFIGDFKKTYSYISFSLAMFLVIILLIISYIKTQDGWSWH